MLNVATEHVLVVPTQVFHDIGYFQGFSPATDAYLDILLRPENVTFRPRGEMEEDPNFKQLIPYVVFCYRDDNGRQFVFQYTRGKGQGEGRLHLKHSVGVGGHISITDHLPARGGSHAYEEGLRREIEEEVVIDTPYSEHCAGLINDDQTEVGKVHLGIVHRFDVQQPAVRSRETDILSADFRPLDEIMADLTGFESWSVITLKALFGTVHP